MLPYLILRNRLAKHSCVPNARVKEWEVAGVPCLVVVANRALNENEEVTLDLGYQLEVPISGQRESFFQSRDENESFPNSISFIETRPRVPDTYSQASRRDREFLTLTLGHRDEIEIYYLHSQASRREREFP